MKVHNFLAQHEISGSVFRNRNYKKHFNGKQSKVFIFSPVIKRANSYKRMCSCMSKFFPLNAECREERRRARVVTAARLRCRKSPLGREFEAGLRHATTGKLSLSTQQ